jgi:succinate dehydrogenase/fumarate reductase flavoprotein subunit
MHIKLKNYNYIHLHHTEICSRMISWGALIRTSSRKHNNRTAITREDQDWWLAEMVASTFRYERREVETNCKRTQPHSNSLKRTGHGY